MKVKLTEHVENTSTFCDLSPLIECVIFFILVIVLLFIFRLIFAFMILYICMCVRLQDIWPAQAMALYLVLEYSISASHMNSRLYECSAKLKAKQSLTSS